jgi:membrane-associated phospholipid phosphatase
MNRAGLFVALFIAVFAGLILGLFPAVDLSIARGFYELGQTNGSLLALCIEPAVLILRKAGFWIEIFFIALPVLALAIKLIVPHSRLLISGRAILFLLMSLALGPGLFVNVGLKDHWGRPRPGRIEQFGGDQHFVAWWQPDGECRKNCSFVSGEASAAFWTLAPAALAPPEWRPLAYGAALTFGVTISFSRMVTGGHFLSDTIFAGVFTFLIVWLTYAAIYRWARTRLNDQAIEDALERFSASLHTALSTLGRRPADQALNVGNCDAEPHPRH